MGVKEIWDGASLPRIGDEVLFDVASSKALHRGTVDRYEVDRMKSDTGFCWRIRLHMKCRGADGKPYDMCRNLEDVKALDWREGDK